MSGFKGMEEVPRIRGVISNIAVSKVLGILKEYGYFSFGWGYEMEYVRLLPTTDLETDRDSGDIFNLTPSASKDKIQFQRPRPKVFRH